MRLWSLHPKYLDQRGLVALWREALLAQAVLAGKTRGYIMHPQLIRFRKTPEPLHAIAAYLRLVHAESVIRGYRFDIGKIGCCCDVPFIDVTEGQLRYEAGHLRKKLEIRAPHWLAGGGWVETPEPHTLFRVVNGDIEDWEVL